MLPAGILAAALFALLAFAPFASAASDPVAQRHDARSPSTTGFTKYLQDRRHQDRRRSSPTKIKGTKATFTVTGGSIDPTTGSGTVTLGGGLKFKAGKKSTTVKGLVLNTAKKSLTGNVGGKKIKFADRRRPQLDPQRLRRQPDDQAS